MKEVSLFSSKKRKKNGLENSSPFNYLRLYQSISTATFWSLRLPACTHNSTDSLGYSALFTNDAAHIAFGDHGDDR